MHSYNRIKRRPVRFGHHFASGARNTGNGEHKKPTLDAPKHRIPLTSADRATGATVPVAQVWPFRALSCLFLFLLSLGSAAATPLYMLLANCVKIFVGADRRCSQSVCPASHLQSQRATDGLFGQHTGEVQRLRTHANPVSRQKVESVNIRSVWSVWSVVRSVAIGAGYLKPVAHLMRQSSFGAVRLVWKTARAVCHLEPVLRVSSRCGLYTINSFCLGALNLLSRTREAATASRRLRIADQNSTAKTPRTAAPMKRYTHERTPMSSSKNKQKSFHDSAQAASHTRPAAISSGTFSFLPKFANFNAKL